MKIACQSCQAKYTIADEKVVGKVVKIRCKKCGSTIVVNGQEGQGGVPAEEPTQVHNTSGEFGAGGGEEGWTVNVSDNDQRTMTTHQVVAEFAQGTVTDETYCWRDGMGDWLPLREIEELASACGISQASAFAQQPSAPLPDQTALDVPGSVRPAAAGGGGGALAGIFGSAPAAAASNTAAARRARTGGADLFGAAAEAGGENDVMTSAPHSAPAARGGDDAKRMGERNENSVLFSLNALTANQPKANGGDSKLVGAAEGDGSGLIDIRALSSSMSSSSGPKKANHVDDIMNLGGGGAFSAALAAPVLTAAPADPSDPTSPAAGNKKMFMMFGALAALLIFGMIGMYFALKPPAAVATAAPEGSGASPASPGAVPPASAAAPNPTAAPAAATPGAVAANEQGSKAAPPSVGVQPRRGGGAAAHEPAAAHEYTPPPAAPAAPAGLDQMISRSVGGNGAPPPAARPEPSNAEFDRGAAAAVLGNIANSVGSCKKPGGPTGDGHVQITFSPDGNVRSAIVDQPPFAGTAVGGCVAGKFRGAHVPAFGGGPIPVGKRFSIN